MFSVYVLSSDYRMDFFSALEDEKLIESVSKYTAYTTWPVKFIKTNSSKTMPGRKYRSKSKDQVIKQISRFQTFKMCISSRKTIVIQSIFLYMEDVRVYILCMNFREY